MQFYIIQGFLGTQLLFYDRSSGNELEMPIEKNIFFDDRSFSSLFSVHNLNKFIQCVVFWGDNAICEVYDDRILFFHPTEQPALLSCEAQNL